MTRAELTDAVIEAARTYLYAEDAGMNDPRAAVRAGGILRDALAALDARPDDSDGGWRDIATAPEDGTFVWLWVAPKYDLPGFVDYGCYHKDGGWCRDELRDTTLWKPCLPPPPPANGEPG